jgi:hypothetical protein
MKDEKSIPAAEENRNNTPERYTADGALEYPQRWLSALRISESLLLRFDREYVPL